MTAFCLYVTRTVTYLYRAYWDLQCSRLCTYTLSSVCNSLLSCTVSAETSMQGRLVEAEVGKVCILDGWNQAEEISKVVS